jgi:SAM-dependent methyltransferase
MNSKSSVSYRSSHSAPGYEARYASTYSTGHYASQWEHVERPLLDQILGEIRSSGAERALDVACGTGRITTLLTTHFPSVHGVDIAANMLSRAQVSNPTATFECTDITTSEQTNDFDVATCFRFFLNAEPHLRHAMASAIARNIRLGGWLVTNTHTTPTSPLGLAYATRNRVSSHNESILSAGALGDVLSSAGFRVVMSTPYGYFPRVGRWFPTSFSGLLKTTERGIARLSIPVAISPAQCALVVARRIE